MAFTALNFYQSVWPLVTPSSNKVISEGVAMGEAIRYGSTLTIGTVDFVIRDGTTAIIGEDPINSDGWSRASLKRY